MPEKKITKENFATLLETIHAPKSLNFDFLYQAFLDSLESDESIKEESSFVSKMNLNPLQVLLYLVNEHAFYLITHPEKKEAELIQD